MWCEERDNEACVGIMVHQEDRGKHDSVLRETSGRPAPGDALREGYLLTKRWRQSDPTTGLSEYQASPQMVQLQPTSPLIPVRELQGPSGESAAKQWSYWKEWEEEPL